MTTKILVLPIRKVKIKSSEKVASIGDDVKILTSLCIIGGKVPGATSMENSRKVTQKVKITICPGFSLLGI